MRPGLLCLAIAALSACSFDSSGSRLGDAGAGDEPDASGCTPSAVDCNGRQLRTCNAAGTEFVEIVDCPFTCGDGACKDGSNLAADVFAACGADAPALTPPPGATLTLTQSGGKVAIECAPDCGNGASSIEAVDVINQPGAGGDLAYFCLAELEIRSSSTLTSTRSPTDRVIPTVALIVHGDARIAGTIDVSGGPGAVDLTGPTGIGGTGGPGAGDGGNFRLSGAGNPGSGRSAGDGGAASASASDTAAGGGGGGGFFGVGGNGGGGQNLAGDETAPGGPGGQPAIDEATNSPLFGGGGGGGGADSNCGGACGYPGGGGGGGLQISARRTILLTGSINANGGDGFGTVVHPNGGAGGGGSGGAILLEAFSIVIDGGSLAVNGGSGGVSGAGDGGAGASGGTVDGAAGTSASDVGTGGAGGGGGSGRIRLQAVTEPTCAASPTASCSTGVLSDVVL